MSLNSGRVSFERFWARYPRHVAKKDAMKAWARLTDEQTVRAFEALPDHVAFWRSRGEVQYIPYPATWINGERWEDELLVPVGDKLVTKQEAEEFEASRRWNEAMLQVQDEHKGRMLTPDELGRLTRAKLIGRAA